MKNICLGILLMIVLGAVTTIPIKVNSDYIPKYLTAYATDMVIFSSVQNTWYQLSNPMHDAFTVTGSRGFHIKSDTLISEVSGMIEVFGQFRVSGPAGQANRLYEYRLRYKRNGITTTFWWFPTSSSGEIVLRPIFGHYRALPGDKIWGEIRTLSATELINFYGGSFRVIKID
jgi:hypothetical protein